MTTIKLKKKMAAFFFKETNFYIDLVKEKCESYVRNYSRFSTFGYTNVPNNKKITSKHEMAGK